jgi:hypothetical protein
MTDVKELESPVTALPPASHELARAARSFSICRTGKGTVQDQPIVNSQNIRRPRLTGFNMNAITFRESRKIKEDLQRRLSFSMHVRPLFARSRTV